MKKVILIIAVMSGAAIDGANPTVPLIKFPGFDTPDSPKIRDWNQKLQIYKDLLDKEAKGSLTPAQNLQLIKLEYELYPERAVMPVIPMNVKV